jgi:hypothetical protein
VSIRALAGKYPGMKIVFILSSRHLSGKAGVGIRRSRGRRTRVYWVIPPKHIDSARFDRLKGLSRTLPPRIANS